VELLPTGLHFPLPVLENKIPGVTLWITDSRSATVKAALEAFGIYRRHRDHVTHIVLRGPFQPDSASFDIGSADDIAEDKKRTAARLRFRFAS